MSNPKVEKQSTVESKRVHAKEVEAGFKVKTSDVKDKEGEYILKAMSARKLSPVAGVKAGAILSPIPFSMGGIVTPQSAMQSSQLRGFVKRKNSFSPNVA